MGRETFATLPGKEPLKERINIVLSRNENFSNDKVIIRRSLTELFGELKNYPEDDIFVIGGQSVYAQLLPYCTQAYVTKIENAYQADRYFVNLDEDKRWVLSVKGETKSYHSIQYSHNIYINTKLSIFQL
jgi:dihydrofolate reductase